MNILMSNFTFSVVLSAGFTISPFLCDSVVVRFINVDLCFVNPFTSDSLKEPSAGLSVSTILNNYIFSNKKKSPQKITAKMK